MTQWSWNSPCLCDWLQQTWPSSTPAGCSDLKSKYPNSWKNGRKFLKPPLWNRWLTIELWDVYQASASMCCVFQKNSWHFSTWNCSYVVCFITRVWKRLIVLWKISLLSVLFLLLFSHFITGIECIDVAYCNKFVTSPHLTLSSLAQNKWTHQIQNPVLSPDKGRQSPSPRHTMHAPSCISEMSCWGGEVTVECRRHEDWPIEASRSVECGVFPSPLVNGSGEGCAPLPPPQRIFWLLSWKWCVLVHSRCYFCTLQWSKIVLNAVLHFGVFPLPTGERYGRELCPRESACQMAPWLCQTFMQGSWLYSAASPRRCT